MNNIQIVNVRPNQQSEGAYVSYSAVLKPTNHTITGNFTATDDETQNAFTNNTKGWDGFKKLVITRIQNDIKNLQN